MPSRIFIVVVLPAPLRPRNPQIEPAGIWRFKPRNASTPEKVFRRSVVSMIMRSSTSASRLGRVGQRGFEQSSDLILADASRSQSLDRTGDDLLRASNRVGPFPTARVLRNERARAVAQLDDAFVFELPVCLRDRVRIHHELLRKRTNSR